MGKNAVWEQTNHDVPGLIIEWQATALGHFLSKEIIRRSG